MASQNGSPARDHSRAGPGKPERLAGPRGGVKRNAGTAAIVILVGPHGPNRHGRTRMGDLLSRVICPGALLFLSWVGMVECCDLSFVSDPGRPLWLRPAGLQTRIRWNVVVPTMLPHSRGRWGPGRAGPILLAASRSHSPARCTAHPELAPGLVPGVGCQASDVGGLLPASIALSAPCAAAHVDSQAADSRAPAGTSPVST